ncbi:MAG: hypothetical protein ACYC0T_20220 [Ramlibacter sp.]
MTTAAKVELPQIMHMVLTPGGARPGTATEHVEAFATAGRRFEPAPGGGVNE